MDNRLTLGIVHIVEWLRPGDQKTGWELFGELEPLGIMSTPRVPVKFWRVSTRQEFIDLFPRFEQVFRETNRVPLLHIETHGDKNGIGISLEDGINWNDLMELFIPLNRLTRLNLVAILAACEGFWSVKMLQPSRSAAAFRALIGPNREVSHDELSRGCLAFYQTVFSERNGDAAFKAMNDAIDPAKETFWSISAETAFKSVYRTFIEAKCTPQAIEERLDKIMANVLERRRREGLPGLFNQEIAAFREMTRQQISDHRKLFDETKREFFFIDEFPENAQRFDLKFENVS